MRAPPLPGCARAASHKRRYRFCQDAYEEEFHHAATDPGLEKLKDRLSNAEYHAPAFDKILKQGVVGVKAEIEEALCAQLSLPEPDEIAVNEYRAMLIALDGLTVFAHRHADEALRLARGGETSWDGDFILTGFRGCLRLPSDNGLHRAGHDP